MRTHAHWQKETVGLCCKLYAIQGVNHAEPSATAIKSHLLSSFLVDAFNIPYYNTVASCTGPDMVLTGNHKSAWGAN